MQQSLMKMEKLQKANKSPLIKKFNEREQLEEDTQYNFDGKISTREVILYSEKEIRKIFDSEGEIIKKLIITKDDKNNITDTEFQPKDGENSHMYSKYEYDENGNILVETKGLKKSSLSVSKTKHEYDKNGNSIIQKNYNYLDGLTNITKNNYDTNGNRIQFEVYRLPLEKASDLKYQTKTKEEDLSISYSGQTKYDNKENIISFTSFNHTKDGNTIAKKDSFSYEYDLKGNWIKKVEFEKNTPKMVIERTIEYYEK